MAPVRTLKSEDLSTRPFADFFWIAGLDGLELLEAYKSQTARLQTDGTHAAHHEPSSSLSRHEEAVEDDTETHIQGPSESEEFPSSSYDRLSKLSDEARRSIQSLDGIAGLSSKRSSNATIRPTVSVSTPAPKIRITSTMTEQDFDDVIRKFATDRDSFSLDVNFREGVSKGDSPLKSKSRTQKIVAEDLDATPHRTPSRTLGSVRRHIAFRDMSSSRRQTSVVRRASARASRRMSSYNAVIPRPDAIESPPNEHPLRRSFEPVLLDRYPRRHMINELARRDPFPDYVPMFAFPHDIQILSSDTRPASTWHEFCMTAADNSKIPAVCVIVWVAMDRETADELEKMCEIWRKANMTDAERELAVSLAERLAVERAQLSQLLAKLPQVASGSSEREDLEERISIVEEKINLMADMLKPLRHGAASRIEGLTDGDTGLWLPRAYGILGRDESYAPVWKEWLKATVTPMTNGAVLRVPASSPRVGMWQPLERYVFNICCEAQQALNSKVQVELSVRELRLYAKKEAVNELRGSRSTDLYPLFRSLTIPNIVVLFEYLLAEARIILVSAHPSMLHGVGKALLDLMWPLEWAGVYIPVLPARLMQVIEAPCPYMCGVVRKGEKIDLPEDDFVMVDLDANELHATEHPPPMPRQQRRKLMSLLYLAAPHHVNRGVPVGPPAYCTHTFPNDMFASEYPNVFAPAAPSTNLVKLAGLSSTTFGPQAAADQPKRSPILNAFIQASPTSKSMERPRTASTARQKSYQASDSSSPMTANFPSLPRTPISRQDSGFALQASLRDKRSGAGPYSDHESSFASMRRKASLPFVRHGSSPSQYSISSPLSSSVSTYAASSYATSTMAASTVMPGMTLQPARNTDTTFWVEGHCMQWQHSDSSLSCAVCDDKVEGSFHRCTGCPLVAHSHCAVQVPVVCQSAFFPDQVRMAFARFFASLFYSYRKFVTPVDIAQRKLGIACKINVDNWARSLQPEHANYIEMLRQTQAFNEFVAEREQVSAAASDSVMLFDALLLAKRGRSGRVRSGLAAFGRTPFASRTPQGGGTSLDFLQDQTTHVWRLVSVPMSSERPDMSDGAKGRDYHTIIKRTPAKLEEDLFARHDKRQRRNTPSGADKAALLRKMNGLSMNAP